MISFFKNKFNRLAATIAGWTFIIGALIYLLLLVFPEVMEKPASMVYSFLQVVQGFMLFILLLDINKKDLVEDVTTIILCFINLTIALLFLN